MFQNQISTPVMYDMNKRLLCKPFFILNYANKDKSKNMTKQLKIVLKIVSKMLASLSGNLNSGPSSIQSLGWSG